MNQMSAINEYLNEPCPHGVDPAVWQAELNRRFRAATAPKVENNANLPEALRSCEEAVKARRVETEQFEAWEREQKEKERQERIAELRAKSRMPERQASRTDFREERWLATREKVVAKLGQGRLVALLGNRGTGKTQLAVCAMEAMMQRLRSARFTLAMDIFLEIRATYKKDSALTEPDVIESYCRPKLLVIDEIQERGESEWEDRVLTHLLNKRYQDLKDTILIGNITPESFRIQTNASIVRRLNETGGVFVCDWPSFVK